jgi:hypothetical protein
MGERVVRAKTVAVAARRGDDQRKHDLVQALCQCETVGTRHRRDLLLELRKRGWQVAFLRWWERERVAHARTICLAHIAKDLVDAIDRPGHIVALLIQGERTRGGSRKQAG